MSDLRFRWMTPDELDRQGSSLPENCRICPAGPHTCGGCGRDILHKEGSTCADCWRVVLDAQQDPSDEEER